MYVVDCGVIDRSARAFVRGGKARGCRRVGGLWEGADEVAATRRRKQPASTFSVCLSSRPRSFSLFSISPWQMQVELREMRQV